MTRRFPIWIIAAVAGPSSILADAGPLTLVGETTFLTDGSGHLRIAVPVSATLLETTIENIGPEEALAILFSSSSHYAWYIHTPIREGFLGNPLPPGIYDVYLLMSNPRPLAVKMVWEALPGQARYQMAPVDGSLQRMPGIVADGVAANAPVHAEGKTLVLDADSAVGIFQVDRIFSVGVLADALNARISNGTLSNDCGAFGIAAVHASPIGLELMWAPTWRQGPGVIHASTLNVAIGISLYHRAYLAVAELSVDDPFRWRDPFWKGLWTVPGVGLLPEEAGPIVQNACAVATPYVPLEEPLRV